MKSSSMNKSYYMIVKLFLCYDVKSNKQTNKKSKYRKYWWTEIQIQQIYKTMHVYLIILKYFISWFPLSQHLHVCSNLLKFRNPIYIYLSLYYFGVYDRALVCKTWPACSGCNPIVIKFYLWLWSLELFYLM
jgi:hypothetical protein